VARDAERALDVIAVRPAVFPLDEMMHVRSVRGDGGATRETAEAIALQNRQAAGRGRALQRSLGRPFRPGRSGSIESVLDVHANDFDLDGRDRIPAPQAFEDIDFRLDIRTNTGGISGWPAKEDFASAYALVPMIAPVASGGPKGLARFQLITDAFSPRRERDETNDSIPTGQVLHDSDPDGFSVIQGDGDGGEGGMFDKMEELDDKRKPGDDAGFATMQ